MQQTGTLAVWAAIAVALVMISSCFQQRAAGAMPQFSELSDQDESRLDARRALLQKLSDSVTE